MITEDYVSYETAKLLKKSGFASNEISCINVFKGHTYKIQDTIIDADEDVTIPTIQLAMKWLREKYYYNIEIDTLGMMELNTLSWRSSVYYLVNENECYCEDGFYSYEQACEAAIKYCLKNLIKNKDEEEEPYIPVPKTVDEAISALEKMLSDKDREYLLKNGAISMHSSLGRWIRNEWGLWTGSDLKNELKKKGFEHPDDMSNYIIEEFIKYWNNKI